MRRGYKALIKTDAETRSFAHLIPGVLHGWGWRRLGMGWSREAGWDGEMAWIRVTGLRFESLAVHHALSDASEARLKNPSISLRCFVVTPWCEPASGFHSRVFKREGMTVLAGIDSAANLTHMLWEQGVSAEMLSPMEALAASQEQGPF
jgi:hypothetical protein